MAAESSGMCLFEAMDHLWFGQIITFSQHNLLPITSKSSQNTTQFSVVASEQQISSAITCSQVDSKSQEISHVQENLVSRKTKSSSTSPKSGKKHRRILGRGSVSCKSLGDLELEELKGFMDVGFVFKKDKLSRDMVSLIPGLQRMQCDGDEEGKGNIMRPYLSEAWLDYPFIVSIRICNNSDQVKKHLRNWARTVAAAIHQES